MPAKLDRCVEDVKGQGKSESSAFAICNSSLNAQLTQKFAQIKTNTNLLTAQMNMSNYSRNLTAKKKLV